MGVGVQRERGFRVAQNAGERFGIHAAGQRVSGEGVPEIWICQALTNRI